MTRSSIDIEHEMRVPARQHMKCSSRAPILRNDSTTQKPPALGETYAAWYGKGTAGKRHGSSSGEGLRQAVLTVSLWPAWDEGSSDGCSIHFVGAPLDMSSDKLYSMFEECCSRDPPRLLPERTVSHVTRNVGGSRASGCFDSMPESQVANTLSVCVTLLYMRQTAHLDSGMLQVDVECLPDILGLLALGTVVFCMSDFMCFACSCFSKHFVLRSCRTGGGGRQGRSRGRRQRSST